MKPKRAPSQNPQQELFRSELKQIIDLEHPLVKLAKNVDWQRLDEMFGATFCPDNGRPAISTRLMVALHYLKYTYDLSDEEVVQTWVENPYWQYFGGMKFFVHTMPIDPSSMTRWRKRIGESGAEELLKATIAAGLKLKAVKPSQLARVNVDTTVQEKEIRFPTDARLYNRARERLVKAAQERDILLRQSYSRKSKRLLLLQSRYAHSSEKQRSQGCVKKLRTYLGRVIRDIERKCPNPDEKLASLLAISKKIFTQERNDKNKVYSVHEPTVVCISKGKAHKRYEFGCKVSLAVTSRGGWVVGALAFADNVYDGRTLVPALNQVERMGVKASHVFVDMGYRGHDYNGDISVHVAKRRRGKTPKNLWDWMQRRSAIEPSIGHLKQEHRMYRNRLKGTEGDKFNALLCAAGLNFRKLRQFIAAFLRLIFLRLFFLEKVHLIALAA